MTPRAQWNYRQWMCYLEQFDKEDTFQQTLEKLEKKYKEFEEEFLDPN